MPRINEVDIEHVLRRGEDAARSLVQLRWLEQKTTLTSAQLKERSEAHSFFNNALGDMYRMKKTCERIVALIDAFEARGVSMESDESGDPLADETWTPDEGFFDTPESKALRSWACVLSTTAPTPSQRGQALPGQPHRGDASGA